MVLQVKCLPCKHGDLCLDSCTRGKLGAAVHVCNPCPGRGTQTEAGGLADQWCYPKQETLDSGRNTMEREKKKDTLQSVTAHVPIHGCMHCMHVAVSLVQIVVFQPTLKVLLWHLFFFILSFCKSKSFICWSFPLYFRLFFFIFGSLLYCLYNF